MRTQLLLSLVITISACGSIAAQTSTELPAGHAPLLFLSRDTRPPDLYVNFETGKRGPLRGGLPGDFDLKYGGMRIEKDGKVFPDWLSVADSRSMIVELGAKEWQDIKQTPPFPQPKKPLPPLSLSKRPIVINVSAGSKKKCRLIARSSWSSRATCT